MRSAATANRAQTSLLLRQAIRAKRSAKAARDRFHPDCDGDVKLASVTLVLRRAPSTQRAEHHCDQQKPSTANDQGQQDCDYGTAGIGFMGARQSNAIKDDFPNPGDQSATKRNHKKRAGRSFCEANHSESSLK